MLIFLNSVLVLNFFCFDALILKCKKTMTWFWYVIQSTCGFHWVSKLMHMTNLAIFSWLSNLWIINKFENMNFKVHPLSIEEVVTSLQLWYVCYGFTLSTIFLGEKCGHFPEIYNIKSVYILQTFYWHYLNFPVTFCVAYLSRFY